MTDNLNPTSLPHNQIWSLHEDKSKTLWICSEGGLSSYNRASRTFTNFYPDRKNPIAPDNTIYSIKEDSKDRYWVFSKAGLYSFEKETKTLLDTWIFESNILHKRTMNNIRSLLSMPISMTRTAKSMGLTLEEIENKSIADVLLEYHKKELLCF